MRFSQDKIVTPGALAEIVREAQGAGKRVVHCHGVFDLVHPGHVNYVEQARRRADLVYVGVVADRFIRKGPGRPFFPEATRLAWMAALEAVDFVVLNEEEGPWSLMRLVRPNLYVKGESDRVKLEDPQSGLNQDRRVMEEIGGTLEFTPELPVHSTDLFRAFGLESSP